MLFGCRFGRLCQSYRFRLQVCSYKIPLNFAAFSSMAATEPSKVVGLILGAYENHGPQSSSWIPKFTPAASQFDGTVNGKLSSLLKSHPLTKDIKQRLFYNVHDGIYSCISVVDIGPENAGYNVLEEIDEKKENIRVAVSAGVKQLINAGATHIHIDPCGDEESVAESANLITFKYDELKSTSSRKPKVHVDLFGQSSSAWDIGSLKADAQNFARYLMETPANLMEPSHFVAKVTEKMRGLNVEVIARDKNWAKEKKMGSFLSVSHGSHVPPLLLELHYNGAADQSDKPVVLVGKGITFDSGGISLKSPENMDKMRGDMGGAAVVVSTIYAAAILKLNINIKGITPLTENMPGGSATKPGDVVFAMNGKSIQVDNTDAEGRLVLADALCYAQTFSPRLIVDLATLTGAMYVALGACAAGVFANDSDLFSMIHKAGQISGDRVWRMPLFNYFTSKVKKSDLADLNNIAGGRAGGSCTAAAFLQEFVGDNKWAHLDIAGVAENQDDVPYLLKGMSGRPTRTLIEFLRLMERNK